LASYDLSPARGDDFTARTPTVALLHADLDNLASRYAPVALAEILRLPVNACLLGHIHRPQWRAAEHGPAVLYPGSPQALDPGETGPHGPWILEFNSAGDVRARQIPLSRIRYEQLDVDLEGATESSDVETRLGAAVREMLAKVATTSSAAELLSLRLEFTGRTPLHQRRPRQLRGLLSHSAPTHGALRAQIEQSIFRTRPSFELSELARASDAPGALARLLIDLDAGQANAECERLVAQAHLRLHEVHHASAFEPVMADSPPDLTAARAVLRESAAALLDELLAQKEPA
jgi:DNA repair exonuclease SbcCD nuclease subunit